MTVINTNVKSLIAQQALTVNNRGLSKAMEQLSTGKRINSAADDAAGLAISNKMTAQVRGLNQAVRNANDAISMVQTAEGALNEVTNMLQRMRELAVQAANDTYSTADREAIQAEFVQLQKEISRISDNTEWNGMKVLGSSAGNYAYQIGANSSQTLTVTFKDLDGASMSAVQSAVAAAMSASSATTLGDLDRAIAEVDSFRADLGSKINRLQYTIDNLSNISINTTDSRSRILDTEYATETTNLAKQQIIQQAATAMLAQANQSSQSILTLLK